MTFEQFVWPIKSKGSGESDRTEDEPEEVVDEGLTARAVNKSLDDIFGVFAKIEARKTVESSSALESASAESMKFNSVFGSTVLRDFVSGAGAGASASEVGAFPKTTSLANLDFPESISQTLKVVSLPSM